MLQCSTGDFKTLIKCVEKLPFYAKQVSKNDYPVEYPFRVIRLPAGYPGPPWAATAARPGNPPGVQIFSPVLDIIPSTLPSTGTTRAGSVA
jgi:hypothetical protein